MKMIIFTKSYCPYCNASKSFCDEQNIEYDEVYLDSEPEKLQELIAMTGMMTVPQIFKDSVAKENLIGNVTRFPFLASVFV